jgi:hypothetical protein
LQQEKDILNIFSKFSRDDNDYNRRQKQDYAKILDADIERKRQQKEQER